MDILRLEPALGAANNNKRSFEKIAGFCEIGRRVSYRESGVDIGQLL
jgi:hypothetical protein